MSVFAEKKCIICEKPGPKLFIFILLTAQTFVPGVTGSGGLTLQPEGKGVFWDNVYR